jgi:histidinol-phosphate aminotransferase
LNRTTDGSCGRPPTLRLIERVPPGVLLCLDEAYGEFAPEGTLPPIDVSDPRVLRFRTFSKAHGMAGARIAYAIGEAGVIKSFDKIRNHFGVNAIALAGALASIGDPDIRSVIGRVNAARDRIGASRGRKGSRRCHRRRTS